MRCRIAIAGLLFGLTSSAAAQMPSGVKPTFSQIEIEEIIRGGQENLAAVETRREKTLSYKDSEEDSGCREGDCQNGTGFFVNENGSHYNGDHKDGVPSGFGTYVWQDGAKYSGNYSGEFVEGFPSGQGTSYYASGDKYAGEHVNGVPQGQGTYFNSKDGWIYVGDHDEGASHGQGSYYYANGQVYVGSFAYGSFNGFGTAYYPDGEVFYEGMWQDNQPAE